MLRRYALALLPRPADGRSKSKSEVAFSHVGVGQVLTGKSISSVKCNPWRLTYCLRVGTVRLVSGFSRVRARVCVLRKAITFTKDFVTFVNWCSSLLPCAYACMCVWCAIERESGRQRRRVANAPFWELVQDGPTTTSSSTPITRKKIRLANPEAPIKAAMLQVMRELREMWAEHTRWAAERDDEVCLLRERIS